MHLLELKINQLVFSRPFFTPPKKPATQNTSPLIRVVIYFRDLLKEPPVLLGSSAFFVYELIFLSLSLSLSALYSSLYRAINWQLQGLTARKTPYIAQL